EDVVPTILDEVGAADGQRTWTGSKRTRREWLHLERDLGRMYSNDALISLSNQLINTSVNHTVYRMVHGGYERLTVSVTWRQDDPDTSEQVIDRIDSGRIDHFPIGFADYWITETLVSTRSFGVGLRAKLTPDKKKTRLKSWAGEIGYGYTKSR